MRIRSQMPNYGDSQHRICMELVHLSPLHEPYQFSLYLSLLPCPLKTLLAPQLADDISRFAEINLLQ